MRCRERAARFAAVAVIAFVAVAAAASAVSAHGNAAGTVDVFPTAPGRPTVTTVFGAADGRFMGVKLAFAESRQIPLDATIVEHRTNGHYGEYQPHTPHTAADRHFSPVAYRVRYARYDSISHNSRGFPNMRVATVKGMGVDVPAAASGGAVTCDALPGGAGEFCTYIAAAELVAVHSGVSDVSGLAGEAFYFSAEVTDDDPAGGANDRRGWATAMIVGDVAGNSGLASVDNDTPGEAVNVIRDFGLENAPIIIGVIGAIFLVGLTFYLVRRGLMKARGAMRL